MVIQESVRYVNVAATFRRCTKPWKIPDTDIIIPVGTDIVIPIMSLHRDPEYWEDPDRFDPERFAPENKAKIRNLSLLLLRKKRLLQKIMPFQRYLQTAHWVS